MSKGREKRLAKVVFEGVCAVEYLPRTDSPVDKRVYHMCVYDRESRAYSEVVSEKSLREAERVMERTMQALHGQGEKPVEVDFELRETSYDRYMEWEVEYA